VKGESWGVPNLEELSASAVMPPFAYLPRKPFLCTLWSRLCNGLLSFFWAVIATSFCWRTREREELAADGIKMYLFEPL